METIKPVSKYAKPNHAITVERRMFFGVLFLLSISVFFSGCATTQMPPYYPPDPTQGRVAACFYDFPEVYEKRIYPVLSGAPGVYELQRAPRPCGYSRSCVCYDLLYVGALERLEDWIRRELPTSKAVPFRITSRGNDFIEVYHDGGFK